MTLHIKNMVCDRCLMVVRSELELLGLQLSQVELGFVETISEISDAKKNEISEKLLSLGFELINDKKSQLIEKIKILIVDLVRHQNNDIHINLSEFITNKIPQDYSTLSHLFSEEVGTTIEKYFILQKIERVKELLDYDEFSLSEIAFQLNYSSVSYLSNQFKKITGSTPSEFKKLKNNTRIQLDLL